MSNPNLAILELVAHALGPVCEDVVFVGGCATGLLLTQARPDRIRITEDVDIVAQALTVHDYHAIEARVRAQEFSALFDNADFETTIAGHLPGDAASQTRLGKLKTTLRSFTSL